MLLGITAALLPLVQAPSEDFRSGDLVTYDPGGGIVFFDPIDLTRRESGYAFDLATPVDTLAWDPFRARVLFYARNAIGSPPNSGNAIYAGDSAGNATPLVSYPDFIEFPECFAPVGDGRVYFAPRNNGFTQSIGLLQADDTTVLLDEAGTGLTATGFSIGRQMEYHAATNSLITVFNANSAASCSGISDEVSVRRYQLSADGLSVESSFECINLGPIDTVGFDNATVRGLQPIDGDSFLLTVWAQGAPILDRLWRIDVDPSAPLGSSLSAAVYSPTSTNNAGGGVFSSTRGEAVLIDYFDDTIVAHEESMSFGDLLTVESFAGIPQLIEIGDATRAGLIGTGSGFIDVTVGGVQQLKLVLPDAANQIYFIGGSLTGFSPFLPVGLVKIPLVIDSYTTLLFQTAGSGAFSSFFGVVDAAGEATGDFTVPPTSFAVFAGTTIHHAAVIFDPVDGSLTRATNAVALDLFDPTP